MLLVPVSAPVIVATGLDPTPTSTFTNNVFLYDLTNPNAPVLVDPATYDDLLPGPATVFPVLRQQAAAGVWVSTAIGIQPAAGTKPGTTKPLKEATEYAFVVTNRIHGLDGKGIGRPTVGSILLFDNPLWAGGKSQLAGITDAQAKALERMRVQIATLLSKLTSPPFTKSDIAVAYTFRTQTITTPALQLAAAPYDPATSPNVNFVGTINRLQPVDAFTKYRVDAVVVSGAATNDNIFEVIEAKLPTPNLLSPSTGAFDPTLLAAGASPPIEVIPALIVVPKITTPADPTQAVPPPCPAPNQALRCAPLVVFHHGLGGGRAQMLLTANELAGKGFVVAAIDAPKHGDRAFCAKNSECAFGSTCQPIGPPGTQGDTTPPGQCKDAGGNATGLAKRPVLCLPSTNCATAGTDGIALASGNFVTSANLFRTRDTFRQDIIDSSGLILALARPPNLPATTSQNPVAAELLANGIVVDPSNVFWEGQSLGGILGTINTAVNPRISRSVLNVPGGTFVDISAVSPAFKDTLNTLLHNLPPAQGGPIDPGTAAYTQFLQVAKWVLDPAEPINFAGRIIGDATHPTLPNLLATPVAAQAGKKVLGQMAVCDNVVPNPFNLLLFNVAGLVGGQVNGFTYFKNTSTTATNGFCVRPTPFDSGTVAHGFLLDHGLQNQGVNDAILSQDARDQAAAFLATLVAQPDNDTK